MNHASSEELLAGREGRHAEIAEQTACRDLHHGSSRDEQLEPLRNFREVPAPLGVGDHRCHAEQGYFMEHAVRPDRDPGG